MERKGNQVKEGKKDGKGEEVKHRQQEKEERLIISQMEK